MKRLTSIFLILLTVGTLVNAGDELKYDTVYECINTSDNKTKNAMYATGKIITFGGWNFVEVTQGVFRDDNMLFSVEDSDKGLVVLKDTSTAMEYPFECTRK